MCFFLMAAMFLYTLFVLDYVVYRKGWDHLKEKIIELEVIFVSCIGLQKYSLFLNPNLTWTSLQERYTNLNGGCRSSFTTDPQKKIHSYS